MEWEHGYLDGRRDTLLIVNELAGQARTPISAVLQNLRDERRILLIPAFYLPLHPRS